MPHDLLPQAPHFEGCFACLDDLLVHMKFRLHKVLLLVRFETEACELNKCPLVLLAFA